MLKNIFIFCCALTFAQSQADETPPVKNEIQNGRYQITSSSGEHWNTEVFLLDTQNGKVWSTYRSWGNFIDWYQLPALPTE